MLCASIVVIAGHHGPLLGELGLLEATNGLPRAIGLPLEALMQLGTTGVALVVAALVAVATARRSTAPTTTVLLAVLGAHSLDNIVKEIIERPRPSMRVDTITVRDAASGFAFPSGHTTTAFALATTVALLLPGRWRWVPFGMAAGAATARMYVGVHWPSDLIGGAALGTLIGAGAWLIIDALSRQAHLSSA